MELSWWPHIERLMILASVLGVGISLYFYYMMRDKSLELRFINREDFRRVESKLDTILAMAAFTAANPRGNKSILDKP